MNRALAILARTGRIGRRVLLVAAIVLVVLVVAIAVTMSLAPARRALLEAGLEQANTRLAGELTVAQADWPALGRIILVDVDWRDGGTELAHADTVALDVAMGDLLRRDILVHEVLAAGVRADVPGIQARLPTTEAAPDTVSATLSSGQPIPPPPFPLRGGALPPLPSFALESLALRRIGITVADDQTIRIDDLDASTELRRGHPGSLTLSARVRPQIGRAHV